MKTLLLAIAITVGAAGCFGATFEPNMSEDLSPQGGHDLAQQGGQDLAGSPPQADAGLLAFGAMCALGTDCQSGLCVQFVQGTVHRCTKMCTTATAATDCPAPSDGTCNNNGYCKFDQ